MADFITIIKILKNFFRRSIDIFCIDIGVKEDYAATAIKVFETEVPQEKKPTIIKLINEGFA